MEVVKKQKTGSPKEEEGADSPMIASYHQWRIGDAFSLDIMNYCCHHDLVRSGLDEIILQGRYPKNSNVASHEKKRWIQAFPFDATVICHFKGIDYEMKRIKSSAKPSLLPSDEGETLSIKAHCDWKQLNVFIKTCEEYAKTSHMDGIQLTIFLCNDEDAEFNSTVPFVHMKHVFASAEMKTKFDAGMKNSQSMCDSLGPKRFVGVIFGARQTGKTTFTRALATEKHLKVTQIHATSLTTVNDLLPVISECDDDETLFVIKDAENIMKKHSSDDFDMKTFISILNGEFTPRVLNLILLFNSTTMPDLDDLEPHITTVGHMETIKPENYEEFVANILKKRKMIKHKDKIMEVMKLKEKSIKAGQLHNALVSYEDTVEGNQRFVNSIIGKQKVAKNKDSLYQ